MLCSSKMQNFITKITYIWDSTDSEVLEVKMFTTIYVRFLLIFHSLEYNLFRFKILLVDRTQHFLYQYLFLDLFETFKYCFWIFQRAICCPSYICGFRAPPRSSKTYIKEFFFTFFIEYFIFFTNCVIMFDPVVNRASRLHSKSFLCRWRLLCWKGRTTCCAKDLRRYTMCVVRVFSTFTTKLMLQVFLEGG
jgi:hypothetical protein